MIAVSQGLLQLCGGLRSTEMIFDSVHLKEVR